MNSYQQQQQQQLAAEVKKYGFIAAGVVAVVLALSGVLGSWFVVDQGERATILRNGAFVRVVEPGLGFKFPIIDSITKMSVRTEKRLFEKMTAYSRDIQLAELRLAVNYRVDTSQVRQVYETYGGLNAAVDRVLLPRVLDEAKVVFGQFNAKESIEKRGAFGLQVEESIRKSVAGTGLIVESVQVEEIDFSKEFDKSIEERMKAEVEVTKLQQNLEREKVQANIVRTQAQAQADATLAKAKAEAESTKLRGDAEATAIRARAHALQQNANLVELVKAERWNGVLPTTMLPGNATPMISLGK